MILSPIAMKLKYFILFYFIWLIQCDAFIPGAPCVINTPKLMGGTCKMLKNCEYAQKLIEKGSQPRFCGLINKLPTVCCPNNQIIKTISEKKCEEYSSPRIVPPSIAHGELALQVEFPHMAAIGFAMTNSISEAVWLCGGTLISELYILTAAHCLSSLDYGDARWVRLGSLTINEKLDDVTQDLVISKAIPHPLYKHSSHYNDIALLKLSKEVSFSMYVIPACLPYQKPSLNEKFIITGWGATEYLGEMSSSLMKATVQIINQKNCSRSFENVSSRKLANNINESQQICAGHADGRDTCQGDSGGPLQYFVSSAGNRKEHYSIIGVTSFGKACGAQNSIGVYTRVSNYIKWIEGVIWPGES